MDRRWGTLFWVASALVGLLTAQSTALAWDWYRKAPYAYGPPPAYYYAAPPAYYAPPSAYVYVVPAPQFYAPSPVYAYQVPPAYGYGGAPYGNYQYYLAPPRRGDWGRDFYVRW